MTSKTSRASIKLSEIGGKRMPFLRWSFVRSMFSVRHMGAYVRVGDGREEALATFVLANARLGDIDDAISKVDEFCYGQSFMMNVGDEKGQILDEAIRRTTPERLLEVGTYCGYSGLRMARAMSETAHLYSIEFFPANAEVARRIWDHAGIGERVILIQGSLGDDGRTINTLEAENGFEKGNLDLVFIDHDKNAYLPDLNRILEREWLHPGSVVVADNVKFPGAPKYRAYMQSHEVVKWQTVEHAAHAEYQSLIKDLVLESKYLGG